MGHKSDAFGIAGVVDEDLNANRRRSVSLTHMNDLGKFMVIAGLALAAVGALIWSGIGRGWFGHLPGDIHVERENFSFHFPLVTCLLLSVVLTVIMWLFRK